MKKLLAAIVLLVGPALVIAGLWMINRGLLLFAAGVGVCWIVRKGVVVARVKAIEQTLPSVVQQPKFKRNSC